MSSELAAADGLDRESLQRLSRRSNARGLAQLAAHVAILGATACLVWVSRGPWIVLALVPYGVVLNFLFCALHESVHRTAFDSRRLNDSVAWIAGAVLLLPPEFFRAFHFAHHRFTQDPERDPELAQPPPATPTQYLWRVSGIPNWSRRLSTTLRHALTGRVREPFVAPAKHPTIVREARWLWLSYAAVLALSIAFRSTAALTYWVVPVLLGQPFLRAYLLSEHLGCPMVPDMYANTRTTYTNAAVRLITWQMPFHAEHHVFPAVPFHRLGQLNALLRQRLRVTAPGYIALHVALLRQLRSRSRRP
ncbi:MAG TPA: fatty acid desaturase [Steroidobacteraceae bacterium]|nr:fatty acid desaturase [Steroidobacteraceae bacterium]